MRTTRRGLEEESRPFPVAQLSLLALVRLAEPIALTSIFPYAWKLVLRFQVGDETDASFYAGLLISAFALAEAVTGMYWGGLSDQIGRRPVLLIGCLGTMISLVIVGFASNFWVALLGRLIGGALNGNIGVLQTMVSEIVVDPKHEPKAYAVMPFVWTIGTIIGPSIGGYFAEPADNFPALFAGHGLWERFPYLLPNLICAGLMLLSMALGWLLIEETVSRDTERHRSREETTRLLSDCLIDHPCALAADTDKLQEGYGTFVLPINDSTQHTGESRIFSRRVVMIVIALSLFSYHSMTYDHLLPIFLQDRKSGNAPSDVSIAIFETGSLAGGLGMSTQQTGVVMSVDGLIALCIQAVVFPVVVSWLGVWSTFVLVTLGHPIAYLVMPGLTLLPLEWLQTGLYAALTIRNLLSILAYPLLLILIKQAVPANNCLGKINGLAAASGAACRTLASPVAGYLYGLGMALNFTAVAWWASALVAILGAIQLLAIPRSDRTSLGHGMIDSHFACGKKTPTVSVEEVDSGYSSGTESV